MKHYEKHFVIADEMIKHLDSVILTIHDPFIVSRYTGFMAVSAVTVYEMSIKDILIDFADSQHYLLGQFARNDFEQLNGRIKIEHIVDEYLSCFGDRAVQLFKKYKKHLEAVILRSQHVSISSCYGNLIVWRNDFAHGGRIPINATYDEVKRSYSAGKWIIRCLHRSLQMLPKQMLVAPTIQCAGLHCLSQNKLDLYF